MEFNLETGMAVLSRTPSTLRSLLAGLPEPWVRGTEGPETFSAFDNVGHMTDGEETPFLGPVTLRQLLAAWVVHDLGHVAQVARVMAKQYREAIGPWVPFLPVVTDHEVPRSQLDEDAGGRA